MPLQFDNLTALFDHGYDGVIDVRSPAEFAIDHVPGAINLPALSNAERAEVGTMYTQVSPFLARKRGAALVLRNIALHLEGPLTDMDGSWRPLVYCWRGGQRSGVFSTILREIGWRAETIKGGYQTYRRLVQQGLYDEQLPHHLVLLDGYTGTAKTALLPLLDQRGVQVIDLEALAGHRGSLIGALPGGQPEQRGFESALMAKLQSLDPTRPTVVEAESSKIGQINLPPAFWSKMAASPRIQLTAPLFARTAFLARAYADILSDPATVRDRLAPLRRVRGHATVDRWKALQDASDFEGLAAALVTDHYDPAYKKSRELRNFDLLGVVHAETLDDVGLAAAADQIAALLRAAS